MPDIIERFEIQKTMDLVFRRELASATICVFRDTPAQVIRDTYVQNGSTVVRQYVNEVRSGHGENVPRRTNSAYCARNCSGGNRWSQEKIYLP